MVDVTEKMIWAGVKTFDDSVQLGYEVYGLVRAVYTAMHSAREVDGAVEPEVYAKAAMAIHEALADQDVQLSPPQELYVAMKAVDATIAAMGEGDVR